MKSDFKTKLIHHMLSKKNGEKGFTLIELLVVIIIIGILAAIALPSFLNQANKAKESEAKTYTGAVNRGQQAYYLEKSKFTTSVGTLGLGLTTKTSNYAYEVSSAASANVYASAVAGTGTDQNTYMNVYGIPVNPANLKGFTGVTYTILSNGENTTTASLCATTNPGAPVGVTAGLGGSTNCPTGMASVAT